jgi:hypothetical protein
MTAIEFQPVENVNAGEMAEAGHLQELDDATFEPQARIEQTGDFRQSEAIQTKLSALMEGAGAESEGRSAAPAGATEVPAVTGFGSAKEAAPDAGALAPKTGDDSYIKVDPDTGETSGAIGTGGGADEPGHSVSARIAPTGVLQRTTRPEATEMRPVYRLDDQDGRAGPVAIPSGGTISEKPALTPGSGGRDAGEAQSPFGPRDLAERQFADQAVDALGYGMIGMRSRGGEGSAHGVGAMGAGGHGVGGLYNNTKQDAGVHSSSGGGAPVHGYGPASKGDGSIFGWLETSPSGETSGHSGTSNDNCGSTTERLVTVAEGSVSNGGSGTGIVSCGGNTGFTVSWGTKDGSTFVKVGKYGNTIDGGSPMPYTGNWSGGKYQPGDPGTIGGKNGENDSGRLMPVVRNSGMGYQGGGGGGNSTDGTSVWDDGNWYGGIFGGGGVFPESGGALPIDPIPHDKI